MALYRYRAVSADGEMISGEMDGRSPESVIARLQELGHYPVETKSAESTSAADWLHRDIFGSSVGGKDVAFLAHELAALLRASLPLDQALAILIDVSENAALRRVVQDVQRQVHGGASLADALAAHPKVFSRLFVSMARAGEASGSLDRTLEGLSQFLTKSQAIRDNVKSALTYPAILLAVAVVSIIVIATVVLPAFEPLFKESGAEPPVLTQVVLAFGAAVRDYGWSLVGSVAVMLMAAFQSLKNPNVELRWHRFLLVAPVIGDLILKLETARFGRVLGTLLGNGVPLLTALALTKNTVQNRQIASAIENISARVKEGEGLTAPLSKSEVFPRLAVHLVRVGEETGRLEDMLVNVADIYERGFQRNVDRMLALLVPLTTIGLGGFVAAIVASVMTAVLSINQLAV